MGGYFSVPYFILSTLFEKYGKQNFTQLYNQPTKYMDKGKNMLFLFCPTLFIQQRL